MVAHKTLVGTDMRPVVEAKTGVSLGAPAMKSHYLVECFDRDGQLKWQEDVENLVVNVGLDDLLDKYFKGSSYTAAHYVGLTDGNPTIAAGDTMSSHAGWAEVADYSQTNRPDLTLGAVSGQSVDNDSNRAEFSINDSATVGGAFVVDNNTKSGTTGVLYGAAAFTADRSVADGDTITVTVTLTTAAA